MKNSNVFKLNSYDFLKGLIVSVLTAILTAIMQMLSLVPPHIDYKQLGIISLTSGIAYLIKQLGTDNNGSIPILKIGGRPTRKKKPESVNSDVFTFSGIDLIMGLGVEYTSDIMSGDAEITNIETLEDTQLVTFNNLYYNDYNSITIYY